jgi:hypothetical protein
LLDREVTRGLFLNFGLYEIFSIGLKKVCGFKKGGCIAFYRSPMALPNLVRWNFCKQLFCGLDISISKLKSLCLEVLKQWEQNKSKHEGKPTL